MGSRKVILPIYKDDNSFEQRQLYDEMLERRAKRRREREDEDRQLENDDMAMRRDFFKQKPREMDWNSIDSPGGSQMNYNAGVGSSNMFTLSFDVGPFRPEEVNIRIQDNKLIVHAKHDGSWLGSDVSREFSRTIDIPRSVDPEQLASTINMDGILQIEAPYMNSERDDTQRKKSLPIYLEKTKELLFRASIDVSQFRPDEINVRMEDNKLIVNAKHEEKGPGKSVSQEFNRSLELPSGVNPDKLACTLGSDGILRVIHVNPEIEDLESFSSKFEPKFKASIDVSQFLPEEIIVRTEDNKVMVHARHEEKGPGNSESRVFSKTVDIPSSADLEKLACTMNMNGILEIEAPLNPEMKETQPNQSIPVYTETTQFESMQPQQSQINSGKSPAQTDGRSTFKIALDVDPDFRPQDIQLRTVNGKMVLEAKREVTRAGRTSCKEFSRQFNLPGDIDHNLVTANFAGRGKIILEVPTPRPKVPDHFSFIPL